jgi:hypothetical protein
MPSNAQRSYDDAARAYADNLSGSLRISHSIARCSIESSSASAVQQLLLDARFLIGEVLEREPYPDVEAQTRRCYVLARRGK